MSAVAMDLNAAQPRLVARDGSTAALEGGAIVLRDSQGGVLVRYQDGCATVAAPRGDLTLAAPHGRVRVQSGVDIALEAARDIRQHAGRACHTTVGDDDAQWSLEQSSARVRAPSVELDGETIGLRGERVRTAARRIEHHAEQLTQKAERYELQVDTLVERARDAYRDVSDLLQTRVGRARMVVRDVFALYSRRNVQVSEDDTAIDGKRVLLG